MKPSLQTTNKTFKNKTMKNSRESMDFEGDLNKISSHGSISFFISFYSFHFKFNKYTGYKFQLKGKLFYKLFCKKNDKMLKQKLSK